MSSLAHHAFLAHLDSGNPVDYADPVIQDQIFSVKMAKKAHVDKIRSLRLEVGKKKSLAYKQANFRTISPVNYYIIDKVVQDISTQLFDNFIWECIDTPVQIAWKEYFHSLYELLVVDRSDHIGNIIMIKEIIKYHDVLEEPSREPDQNDTVIFTLKRLFSDLKREQKASAQAVGDVTFQMNQSLRLSVEIQHDLHNIYHQLRRLGQEVTVFTQILEKIRADGRSDQ